MLESPTLVQIIEEKTTSVKETLTQEAYLKQPITDIRSGGSFAEKARDFGSCVAHEILDRVETLGSSIPQAFSAIGEVGRKFFPEKMVIPNLSGDEPVDPVRNYNDTVSNLHDKIDDVF